MSIPKEQFSAYFDFGKNIFYFVSNNFEVRKFSSIEYVYFSRL